MARERKNGIEVDMRITKVDGKSYHESLLDKRIAGKKDFELTFVKLPPTPPPTPKPKSEDDDPPRPDFNYATELNPTTFKEMVYAVTNGTKAKEMPPYYPVVMFHVSWCKHCRHALPEFEKAAQMVEEEKKNGKRRFPVYPKLFLIECDTPPEHKPVCDMHVGSNYPVIKTFRDRRSVHFNRPRMAQTFAWWALHVSRPPLVQVDDGEALQPRENILWLMHVDIEKDIDIFNHWKEVAIDNIEDHTFAFVRPGSKAGKMLPPPPSVAVVGLGLEPVEFEGSFTREALSEWVNFNQFAPVAELSPYTDSALRKSGFVVVALMYRSKDEKSRALGEFEFKAKQMRAKRQFIFASIDVSQEENMDYMKREFQLVEIAFRMSPTFAPLIFAFEGKDIYWESPSMREPSELSMESIGAFLSDSEARQDKTSASWFKMKRKIVWRFANGSTTGMVVTSAIVLAVLAGMKFCCIPCVKGIFASDDEEEDKKD